MKEIRVLHIGLSSNVGGIETVVHSWLKYKPEWLRFDFVQVGNEELAFKNDFTQSGGKIYKLTPRSVDVKMSNKELKEIIEKGNYDYVQHHLMTFSWPEPAIITNKISKSEMILHAHTVISGQFSTKYKILHLIGKLRLRRFNYLEVACSEEAGKAMYNDDSFFVVRNGIDFSECKYNVDERERIRTKLGYKKDDIIIGHVGRSAYEKNYPFLLNTFKTVHSKMENARLLLIGDILEDRQVQDLIDKLAIREYVICTGPVKGIRSYYSAMDLYFMPSIIEGVSVSLLEAQASGLTCVVSENVSKESAISKRCIFVPINETSRVSELLLKEANNRSKRREKLLLEEKYDLKATSNSMYEIYKNHMER